MNEIGKDIRDRTFGFAVRMTKLVNALPSTVSGRVMARQLMRAGSSVGANVEEAQGAGTKKDFARRMNIARSEAREAHY
jgi:four helix bundle protein